MSKCLTFLPTYAGLQWMSQEIVNFNEFTQQLKYILTKFFVGAMYESEEEESNLQLEHEQLQFEIHKPSKTTMHIETSIDWGIIKEIERQCNSIRDDIEQKIINEICKNVVDLLTKFSNDGKKNIYPFRFKRNQQTYLKKLVNLIQQDQNFEVFPYNPISIHPQDIHERMPLIIFNETKITNIALKIYILYTKIAPHNPKITIINNEITDLSAQNIYVFEQSIGSFNCILVLPTYSNFERFNSFKYNEFQVIQMKMYQNSLMFYQFMYQCVLHHKIKAYLPKQCLMLIQQFQQFPLSYCEGVRRLTFCIKQLHMLSMQKKIQIQYVKLGDLFEMIEESFIKEKKHFNEFTQESKMKNRLLMIQLIFDHQKSFSLTNCYRERINFMNSTEFKQEKIPFSQIIQKIRKRLTNKLQSKEDLSHLKSYLESNPFDAIQRVKIRNRNKIEKRYQVDTKVQHPEDIIFQQQIKQMILLYTERIRKQCQKFKWQEFKYQKTIKPMIPFELFETMKKAPMIGETLKILNERYHYSLSYIFKWICDQNFKQNSQMLRKQSENEIQPKNQQQIEKIKHGRAIFLLKELSLYGFIEFGGFIQSKIVLQHHSKSKFWRQLHQ